jgi:hypothetical protein
MSDATPSLFSARDPGPGCPRHEGDPHNLCPECWKLEPEAKPSLFDDAHRDSAGHVDEALERLEERVSLLYDTRGQGV